MPALPNDVIEFCDLTASKPGPVARIFGPHPSRSLKYRPYDLSGAHVHAVAIQGRWSLAGAILQEMAARLEWAPSRSESPEVDLRHYHISLHESFKTAASQYQSVSIDPNVMAGAPCIQGTRIPVYMVLDAIEHYGALEGAYRSYPRLTMQQVKDAIGFAKLVVECPIDDETSPPA